MKTKNLINLWILSKSIKFLLSHILKYYVPLNLNQFIIKHNEKWLKFYEKRKLDKFRQYYQNQVFTFSYFKYYLPFNLKQFMINRNSNFMKIKNLINLCNIKIAEFLIFHILKYYVPLNLNQFIINIMKNVSNFMESENLINLSILLSDFFTFLLLWFWILC